jgi:hypothetical protein
MTVQKRFERGVVTLVDQTKHDAAVVKTRAPMS